MTQKLLIPKNFKFMGKDQQTLYKEAMGKKDPPIPPTPPSGAIPSKHFGKVAPLIGSDGKTKEFTIQEALAEAKKQGKTMVQLKDSDAYVLKNGGYYWTGDLICYPKPGDKFGEEIHYTDGNDNQDYLIKIPKVFQNLKGDHMLKLIQGQHSDGKPFYEYNYDAGSKLWIVQINHEDGLIQSSHLHQVRIHRQNGYYITDAELIPNGAKSDSNNKAARYLYVDSSGPYLGLLLRGGVGGRGVGADWRPSCRRGVLAYE